MEITATSQATDTPVIEKPQDTLPPKPNQSVYVADKDLVKTYPVGMSNNEIDYDLHTTVREKSPEDYFVNFLPLTAIQEGFKKIALGGLTSPAVEVGARLGEKVGSVAVKYQDEVITPSFKYAVTGDLEKAYKPWIDIWRESEVGKAATGLSDQSLVNAHPAIAAIPWFVAEFVPEQLLEFGTKPLNWVGAYGVEKFGPPVINAAIQSKWNQGASAEISNLFNKIFKGEIDLAKDFDTLGIKPNAKTSEVVNAYKDAAKYTHPDITGGPSDAFNAVNTAYQNIMKSRGGIFDNLFDMFRGQEVAVAEKAPRGIKGLLSDQRGFALVPDSGDLVKIGKEVGKVIDISGQIATVNIAGRAVKVGLDQLEIIPKNKESAVNPENLSISPQGKEKLTEATSILGEELTSQGKSLTHEEVIQKSQEADILTKGVSREATLEFQASLLKTRKHLAALAEEDKLTPEFLDALKVMSNIGTDIARNLESFKIEALPEHATVKVKIIKDLQKLGITSDKILEAAKDVDFKDEQSVAKFYRKFVKPKFPELLDEFAYMNILSSPLTHIKNTFSNLVQLAGLNPLTKLASGAIDFMGSRLTGEERTHYISEVPDFYKGVLNAMPKAFKGALDVMKGKRNIERPDIKHLPTLSKLVDYATLGIGKYAIRALEASDVLFRTMIEAGEIEALSNVLGHEPSPKESLAIQKEATKRANYFIFRNKPDATNASGQGKLLSGIDQMTNAVYGLRKVPGLKWFIRFVQTPMNIFKQMFEYSPAGVATIPGSKDKYEQAGKAAIGSLVFTGASWLAANNLTTWSSPTSAKEKNEFYAAGLQPYSIRIGDEWVSYSQIGPLAGPIAMAAALHYFTKDSPNALSDSEMDKVVDAMGGLMKFFSDQSYMQGMADLVAAAHGEKSKVIAGIPTQMIPLSSLQGWVNNILDPLQRKATKGLSIESVIDQIQMKIVGMSKLVPAQIDLEEIPVKKQMRGVNAISPIKVSKVDKGKLAEYKDIQKTKQEVNKMKKELS